MRKIMLIFVVTATAIAFGNAVGLSQQSGSTDIAGGRGGNQFVDPQPTAGMRVTEVRIRAGDTIDAVQMVYAPVSGSDFVANQHGGSGGRLNAFRLDSDEYITGISGRYGDTIDSMRIHTNKKTSPTYGGSGGSRDFRIEVPSGTQAVGFAGRSGDTVDAIGLTFAPLSMPQANGTMIAGGNGGSAFSDSNIPQEARISEIRVRARDRIDSIQMIYALPNGSVLEGALHGGRGGSSYSFRLDVDEYIVGLSGRSGDQIDSLRIHTNKRTSPTFGGRGGNTDFQIDVPAGSQAVGFIGRAGRYLNAVGLSCTTTSTSLRQVPSRRIARQALAPVGETIAALPSSCNIPRGSNRCSVTVQVTNPNWKSVQVWARGPLDSQEKAITGIFADVDLSITFDWVYRGTVIFSLYEVTGNSKTPLATATAVGVATRDRR